MALRATQGTLTSTPFLLCTETRFLGGNLSQFEPTELESLTRVFQAKASAPKRGDGEVRGTREEGTCHKRQVPLPTPHCLSTTHVRRHGEPTSPSTSYKRVQSSTTSEGTRGRGPERGAQQKRDSAHGRGRGGDSSGGAGDAKSLAGARAGNATTKRRRE